MLLTGHSLNASRLRSLGSGAAVGALVALHGWALARRLVDGTLLEPSVVGKWLASLALVGLFWWLRRVAIEQRATSGADPRLDRRRLVVFWILVLLVHALGTAPPLTAVGAALQQAPISALGLLALPAGWALRGPLVNLPESLGDLAARSLQGRAFRRLRRLARQAAAQRYHSPLAAPRRRLDRCRLSSRLRCLPAVFGPLSRRPPPAFVRQFA